MIREELTAMIIDLLELEPDITNETSINLFEYDSFTKVNLIVALESYSNDVIDLEALLVCDSYGALIELAEKMKKNTEIE